MEKIKLVIVDIDGTLLNDQKICPEANVKAIKRLKEYGIKFGIASGRPVTGILRLAETWGIVENIDCIVGCNGAELYYSDTKETITGYLLEQGVVKSIEKLYRDLDVAVSVYHDDYLVINKEIAMVNKQVTSHKLAYKVCDFGEFIKQSYPKVLMMMDPEYQPVVLAHSYQFQSEQYKVFPSAPNLLEFVDKRVSKSNGIRDIAKTYSLKNNNILCFGDTTNDLEMIADYVGVWMNNGTDDIKAVAKYQTISNNDAGIAHFLEMNIF